MIYRSGTLQDAEQLRQLGITTWSQFKNTLTPVHFEKLLANVGSLATYTNLFTDAHCFVCLDEDNIIGMAFLVASGQERDIYQADWCSIRFVTVHPAYTGKGIGRKLTQLCIDKAKENGEKTIALHTSEFMPNARHIYESFGFTILKELPPRLGKKYWLYTMEI